MNISPLELATQEFKELASNMSYFNAAEGSDWSKESEARKSCCKKLKAISRKVLRLGGNTEELARGFLISTGDYFKELLTAEQIKVHAKKRAEESKFWDESKFLEHFDYDEVVKEEAEYENLQK